MPAGLSTRSSPPPVSDASGLLVVAGGIVRFRAVCLYLRKQRFYARRALDALILTKNNSGRHPQAEGARDACAQMPCDAFQSLEGRALFFLVTEDTDKNTRVTKIGGNLDPRHRYKTDDPRIFCRFGEKSCDFFPNGFSYAVGAPVIAQRPPA
jgi:hypothetical protein